MAAVSIAVMPLPAVAPPVVKLARAVAPPPISPPKVVVPSGGVGGLRGVPVLANPPRVMVPAGGGLSGKSARGETVSPRVCEPVVVIAAALIVVEPLESVVKLVSGVVPPTVLLKVVLPAVLTVKLNAPSTVLPKVMAPLLVEASVASAPSMM